MRSSVSRWIRGAVVRFSTRSLNILPGADAFRIPPGSRGTLPIRRTVPPLLSRPYQAPVRSVADRTVTPHRVPVMRYLILGGSAGGICGQRLKF